MWIYSQSSGQLWDEFGGKVSIGYSGHLEGKNNPDLESVAFLGPLPKGDYVIGDAFTHETLGKLVMALTPDGHDCLGRDDFAIHGDSATHPGEASRGCMIMKKSTRLRVANSYDKKLRVIE